MKESFNELVEALWQCREKCPWAKGMTIEGMADEIRKEAEEIKAAVGAKNFDEIREEVGDTIMVCIYLALIAEEKGVFTIKDVFKDVTEKLKRRKPWVFGDEKITTIEGAIKRWKEIKAKEKKEKNSI